MPLSSRPGTGRSRGWPAPPASTIASNSGLQLFERHVDADIHARPELDAFLFHQRQPAVQDPLLHLELGNAVAQQAADAIGLFEHRHEMTGAVQLLGRRQTRRTRSDDGDRLARADERRLRRHPSFVECLVDDRHFDRLDRDRIVVDAEHARPFARRRTQAPGELGEIVRRVQPLERGLPAVAIDEIVPVGNQVAERTSLMAERNAAIHAPRALLLELVLRIRKIDFLPVLQALGDRTRRRLLAMNFDESCRFSHKFNKAGDQKTRSFSWKDSVS